MSYIYIFKLRSQYNRIVDQKSNIQTIDNVTQNLIKSWDDQNIVNIEKQWIFFFNWKKKMKPAHVTPIYFGIVMYFSGRFLFNK